MGVVLPEHQTFWDGLVCVSIMTAGTIFLMWIGEQIDEYGIGNGISLIIMAGIVARIPDAVLAIFRRHGFEAAAVVGRVGPAEGAALRVVG
jgi:preprotein translocase subunit SecY